MSYNDILDFVEREHNNEDGHLWKFRKIVSHSLILGKKGKDDKIKVQMLWETDTTSTEYFETLKKEVPIDLAIYAKENDLLEGECWKTLKQLTNRSKLTERLAKQAKLQSFRISLRYKYGLRYLPTNFKNAQRLNKKNSKIKWVYSNTLEHEQFKEYDLFRN